MRELLECLPPELMGEALTTAKAIGDEGSRISVLAQMAERLPAEEHAKVMGEALAAARAIDDEEVSRNCLGETGGTPPYRRTDGSNG